MISFKKIFFYFSFFLFCIFCGAFFFLIQRNWLVIHWTFGFDEQRLIDQTRQDVALRRKLKLYYSRDDKFFFEDQTFVWFSNKSENLKHLINNWLSFLHEERVINKKVALETVSLEQTGQEAYFSFDQTPLHREWSIFKKWNFIESMFKTIRGAGLDIKTVVFLVGHQQLDDDHLDFSMPWPVDGFWDE